MANCTINEKLQYILETKDLIKAALISQDIEVLESDTFRKYAEYITEIRKVSSVNGKVGDVTITAEELGALTEIPSEYITESELNDKGYLTSIPDDYALKTDIPTNVSELNNDANYITLNEVPKTDLSDYYTKEEVDGKIPDVSNFITSIPSEYITETELNDKGYITEIPSEYITESELNDKGYLTSIPDTYITEDELTTALSDKVSQTALNEAIEGIDVGVKTINNTKGDINIKTINGESILGEGDIQIKSDSEETDPIFDKWKNADNVIVGNGATYDTTDSVPEDLQPSIMIGKGANVWADGIAIGENAYSEMGAVAIGKNVKSYGIVSIGKNNEGDGIIIGKNNSGYGIIIGENITGNYGGIAIGDNISNPTDAGIAIGNNAKISTKNPDDTENGYGIAIGCASIAYGKNDVAIGKSVETDATYTTNINNIIKGDSNEYAYIKDENGNYIKILDLINNGGGSSEGGSVKVVEMTQAEYDALLIKEEGVIYVITDAAEIAIPTKLSELENDKGYITEIPSEYVTDTELNTSLSPLIINVTQGVNSVEVEKYSKAKNTIYYKTINGESILGEGNIEIEGGGGSGTIYI